MWGIFLLPGICRNSKLPWEAIGNIFKAVYLDQYCSIAHTNFLGLLLKCQNNPVSQIGTQNILVRLELPTYLKSKFSVAVYANTKDKICSRVSCRTSRCT